MFIVRKPSGLRIRGFCVFGQIHFLSKIDIRCQNLTGGCVIRMAGAAKPLFYNRVYTKF